MSAILVAVVGFGTPFTYGASKTDDLWGPAKVTLPTIEEKKNVGVVLEGSHLDDEIATLSDSLAGMSDGPEKTDLMFRLAERSFEKYRALHYHEMQEYDKSVQNWIEERGINPGAPEPAISNQKSQAALQQALEVSHALITRYRDYPRRDELIFSMGFNVYESGDTEAGLKMYRKLMREHPESRFLPDASLAVGEHYFSAHDIPHAMKAYQRAQSRKDSKASLLALYKLAWCDYLRGRYAKAIEKFKELVDSIPEVDAASTMVLLRRYTLRDLALAYSRTDTLDEATEYFNRQVGESSAFEYLRALSQAYERRRNYTMAIKSFRLLINDYPNDSDCPLFQNSIVRGYRALNKRDDVRREVNRLIEQYQSESTWALANKDNQPALQKAAVLVEEALRDSSRPSGGAGQPLGTQKPTTKTKGDDDALYTAMVTFNERNQFMLAVDTGKRLVDTYPRSDHLHSTIYLLSRLHERIADFESAARFSEMCFDQWLSNRQRHRKAMNLATGTIIEGENDVVSDKQAQEALLKAASLRESMGEYAKAITAYVNYIKYFPDAADTAEQLYRVALIYERLGKWRDADHIWEGYLKKYASTSPSTFLFEILYKHIVALYRLGNEKESYRQIGKLIDVYSKIPDEMRTPEMRQAVSHVWFLQQEPEYNTFINLQLTLPLTVLKRNLFIKIDTRPKLEKKYNEIIALQDPDWSVAALVRLGQINHNLSQSLFEAPTPRDQTSDEHDRYTQEMRKQAIVFEENATDYFKKAIALSTTSAVYNEWTLVAQDMVRIYQPTLYPARYKADCSPTEYFYKRGPHPKPQPVDSAKLLFDHYNNGVDLMGKGDRNGARTEFEKVLTLDPRHRDAVLNLGWIYSEETKYVDAIMIYKNALYALPDDAMIMNNLIACYRLNQQYQEAEATGHRLLTHSPDDINAHRNMTLVYYAQGKYKMAELFATNAIKLIQKLRQNDPLIPEDAGNYNNLGLIYLKTGRSRDAMRQFSKALEIKPDDIDTLINTGALAHQYRDYARAVKSYKRVLCLEPDNYKALRGLAYSEFGIGDAQRTIELMNTLLSRNADETHAYYVLGEVYELLLNDFPNAINYYERYLEKMGFALNSDDPARTRLASAKAKHAATAQSIE